MKIRIALVVTASLLSGCSAFPPPGFASGAPTSDLILPDGGTLRQQDTRIDLFDARSNRTGYGYQRPDGSVDLFRPDGSRLGTIQTGIGGQPSRILLPKGKR